MTALLLVFGVVMFSTAFACLWEPVSDPRATMAGITALVLGSMASVLGGEALGTTLHQERDWKAMAEHYAGESESCAAQLDYVMRSRLDGGR